MNMENDIKKAITENLPQAVGEELRKRLEQADADRTEVARFKDMFDSSYKRCVELEREVKQLTAREQAVAERESVVAVREKEITKLELTARFEAEKRALAVDLFQSVFRNRVTRESVLDMRDNLTVSRYSNGESCEQHNYQPVETTKTTEHE